MMANWSHVDIKFPGITQEQWKELLDRIGVEPTQENWWSEWDMTRLGGTPPDDAHWGDWMVNRYGAVVKECGVDHKTKTLSCRGRWDAAPDKFCDMLADECGMAPIDMYWFEEGQFDTTFYYRIRPKNGRFGVRREYGSIDNICAEITREVPEEWYGAYGMLYSLPRRKKTVTCWYGCYLDDEGNIQDETGNEEADDECQGPDDVRCDVCGKKMEQRIGYRYYPEDRRLREYGPALYCGWCAHYRLLTPSGHIMMTEDEKAQEKDPKRSKLFFCPFQLGSTCNIELEENGGVCITM